MLSWFRLAMVAWALAFPAAVRSAEPPTLQERLAREPAAALAAEARKAGDAGRGAVLFFQPFLTCAKCHDPSGGTPLGPDLAAAGKEATAESLVESVLLPSKAIKKGFETVTVTTTDGRTVTGLIVSETVGALTLADPSAGGRGVTVAKADIEKRTVGVRSLMPEGLVNLLSDRQQFLDLVKYLIEIAEGGQPRAAELRPAVTGLVIPEYEKDIDHAGLIRGWDTQTFRRGEAIYTRVCANCHGTKDQLGSLPTSLRFASDKFKNGSDPYSLYQTLTRGYGLMAPQTWMVPRQKYDVIYYLREAYLKPHNPTQYVATDPAYLAKLPKGTTVGPAPSAVEPWVAMDYGTSLINTYEVGGRGPNIAYKGIAVRLDAGAGGISRGSRWAVYDHDTLRLAAAWTGSGFIDWHGIHFNGQHAVHPKLVGDIHLANPVGPGWADPATGSFRDPRPLGRDNRPYGPLPQSWARYRGLYHFGDRTIVSYTVGDAAILESPGAEVDPTRPGEVVFTRTLEIGKSSRDLLARVAPIGVTAAVVGDNRVSLDERDGFVVLKIPASATPTRVKVLIGKGGLIQEPGKVVPFAVGVDESRRLAPRVAVSGPPMPIESPTHPLSMSAFQKRSLAERVTYFSAWDAIPSVGSGMSAVRTMAQRSSPPAPLEPLTHGGPKQWPEVLKAPVTLGRETGPFAVDTFALPERNPWNAQLRLTGFDFYPDGKRMAVCSWDGDVWLVSGLDNLAAGLTWQRLASGLFQPLGLKFRDGQIFVCCRDQIVRLHDLNGDGETDFYECFNSDHQVTEHFHEFAMGLQTDDEGNFYYAKSGRHALPALVPHHGTLLKVARDGSKTEILATGFRAANGVCLNPDGSFFVTDQEGFWTPKNRINRVTRGGFYGNMWGFTDITDTSDAAMKQPVCWITNDFDRSPAELVWVTSDKWGPLRGSLLNISYGHGKLYVVPHELVNGEGQGGMCALPLPPFPTGIMRGRFHPTDGQLYTCGMFAWAGNQTQPGGFYRVRYTGKPIDLPVGLKARAKTLEITFTDPLDPTSASDPANYSLKTWGLKRSVQYGSKHIDEKPLAVSAATLAMDGKTVRLTIPDLAPTWGMEVKYRLKGADGRAVSGTIHNTIHALPEK